VINGPSELKAFFKDVITGYKFWEEEDPDRAENPTWSEKPKTFESSGLGAFVDQLG
jgi:hypothetical protein